MFIKQKGFAETVFVLLGFVFIGSPAMGEPYFTCEQGYTFQAGRDVARCVKPGRTESIDLLPCPTFHAQPTIETANMLPCVSYESRGQSYRLFAKMDMDGNKDMCTASPNPPSGRIAIEMVCPNGYTKSIVQGWDTCTKSIQAKDIKTIARTDSRGNTDECIMEQAFKPSGIMPTGERACPDGYKKNIVPGIDTCTKTFPVDVKAPSVRAEM